MKNKQEQDLELKNAELEKQLAAKNRELEIEASLERVRAVAMGMTRPEDLLNISRSLFKELQLLEFSDLRNAIIHTYTDDQSYFIDYDYSDFTKGHISHIPYSGNPILERFVHDIRKTKDAFTEIIITGKELKKWQTFRDANNEAPDERLSNAHSLYYYMYSIGSASIGISTFTAIPAEKQEVLKRFRNVFDLAYRRYVDIRLAEIQIREAQIELGLERVRARAMAMQSSVELADLIAVVFSELGKLNFNLRGCGLYIMEEVTLSSKCWIISPANIGAPEPVDLVFVDLPFSNGVWKAWKEKLPRWVYTLEGDDKRSWHDYLLNESDFRRLPDAVKAAIRAPEKLVYSFTFSNFGGIQTVGEAPLSDANLDVLSRFGKVFDLTYTRFNDLKQAEAQAREALIELALERVRARTMAMQKSDELRDIVKVVFERLQELNFAIDGAAFIATPGEISKEIDIWAGDSNAEYPTCFRTPFYDTPMIRDLFEAKESGSDFFSRTYSLDEKNKWFAYAFEHTDYKYLPEELKNRILGEQCLTQCFALAKNSGVGINFHSQRVLSDIETDILKRFSKVFEQSYIRFLDLQKAEAQAHESHIEAALERVRSRTMGMQKSDELAEVIQLVYDQLCQLNFNIDNANFVVNYKESDDLDLWLAVNGQRYSTKMHIPYLDHPIFNRLNEAKKKGLSFFNDSLTFEEKNTFFRHFFENAPQVPQDRKKAVFESAGYTRSVVFMNTIALGIQNYAAIPYSDAENAVLVRFGKVFEQTYTRFNDLKQAEEQAREATIEAALERVRSKTMAMHNSEDVSDTVITMFAELLKLGVETTIRCGVAIIDNTKQMELWTASEGDGKTTLIKGQLDMSIHPLLQGVFKAWKNKEQNVAYELAGKDMIAYYQAIIDSPNYPYKPDLKSLPEKQINNAFFFPEGLLFAFTIEPLSAEATKLFTRFAGVFGLTYRRFLDLQKAEAQTREAIKQASVDRVRGEIASMRSTDDLERITPLIWNELTILGIPFIRCGVFIVNEEEQLIHTHLSTADGKALATFNLQFESEGIGQDVLPAWRAKQIATIHWSKEEFAAYTNNLVSQGTVQSKERYVTEHPDTSLVLHFFPFLQGMLYVGNIAPLLDDEKDLVQSLADAFSTAYARYEDFNKLEAAKQQVENTLADLKAAQTKLIQSEKMASLGELTAGIAHEIQNPLNFVNNFSEVNQEMIDELEEELKAGNVEEALAIAADIKQNEEKISHHGKRADGIVKGMLQHSRTGGVEKQLTNMNVLADEFLRLSYHGLRAKDKTFNAEMVTHFDPDLPKISVIAQDMGRVMLNLFNNAFYAVNQKKKTALPDYRPEVSVSTSQENGQVIIKVKDNGTGMPEHVKEKIMQPFFTTKPTGEGTGLGLSLTYDMVVKGHGGNITVNTKEGEGSEFVILLPVN